MQVIPPIGDPNPNPGRVAFVGSGWRLLAIVLNGYLMMIPTLGLYRFWLLTQKRRFLWSHTEIDGDPLEYTGHSIQLLIGFLMALAVFLPFYGLLFYLSTQTAETVVIGYAAIGLFLYFLAGYAMYRARRFRLTRTFWRGIRFHQTGSAWIYALKRFWWTILMIPSLGLVYPFMVSSLYRYRFENTWFGDRKFSFSGRWRTIAGPYYGVYALNIVAIGVALALNQAYTSRYEGDEAVSAGAAMLTAILAGVVLAASIAYFVSRRESRMLSSVSLGPARLKVRVRARALLGQYLLYALAFLLITAIFGGLAVLLIGLFFEGDPGMMTDLAQIFGEGGGVVLAFGLSYLLLIGAYALLWELIIGLGHWKLLANGAVVADIDTVRSVRALGSESPTIGEGLADALNVGAY